MYTLEDDKKIEYAISFLAKSLSDSGKNPKPVLLHSIRVTMELYKEDHDTEVVQAAILHDILEDTQIGIEVLADEFGESVTNLVMALTLDNTIDDYVEQYEENFQRLKKFGKDAIIIRAVDILDNSNYYELANQQLRGKLWVKLKQFVQLAEPYLKSNNGLIWKKIKEKSDLNGY